MSERVERKLRCPKDYRTVARVLVSSGGVRVVETVTSRVGDDMQQRHRRAQELHRLVGTSPTESTILRRSGGVDAVRYTVVDADPYAGMDELDALAEQEHYRRYGEDHVWPGARLVAACPKCHRGYTLVVGPDGRVTLASQNT